MAVVKRSNPPFSIYLSDDAKERISVVARRENRSINRQIIYWLDQALKNEEAEPSVASPAGAKQRARSTANKGNGRREMAVAK